MEQKQTAVEWLIDELSKFEKGESEYFSTTIIKNKAIRMEKQQIMELKFQTLIAYGVPLEKAIMFSEQYYNKEYGK